jgi:hypothetical protein
MRQASGSETWGWVNQMVGLARSDARPVRARRESVTTHDSSDPSVAPWLVRTHFNGLLGRCVHRSAGALARWAPLSARREGTGWQAQGLRPACMAVAPGPLSARGTSARLAGEQTSQDSGGLAFGVSHACRRSRGIVARFFLFFYRFF